MRVGFTVTKKIGGAVVRNRMKRRFRALAREIVPARRLSRLGPCDDRPRQAGSSASSPMLRHGARRERWTSFAQMIARLLILVARGWQKGPSQVLPPSCRYQPSCSAYAITAIQRYGAARGSWLALKRICRCHPWGGQGYDPVPESHRRGS